MYYKFQDQISQCTRYTCEDFVHMFPPHSHLPVSHILFSCCASFVTPAAYSFGRCLHAPGPAHGVKTFGLPPTP